MCRIKYLLLLTAFIIMGCQVSEQDDSLIEKRKNKVEEVAYQRAFKVGVMPTMDCLPIFLLKDSALYNPDDIDIRLKEYTSQRDCDTAMINRRVQAAVLDYMTETNATWQLMATPASGIKQVEDLGDKVIGLAFNSVTQYLTIQVISSHSIKNRTYGSQINDIFIRMQMLRNKQLDAVWTSEPQTTQAKILGNKEIYNSTKQDFTPGAIVFVNAPKVEKRQAFEDAYNKAVDMINKHPIQYFAPLIKKYMRVDDKVISALPNMVYKRVTPPRQRDIIKAQNAIM